MDRSILAKVKAGSTALREGQALGRRAAQVGFDWPTALRALEKVREEVEELGDELRATDDEVAEEDRDRLEDELGDVLFAVANVARKLDIDAEAAMARTNRKFRERFAHIEEVARDRGLELEQMSLGEMESIWQESKARLDGGRD